MNTTSRGMLEDKHPFVHFVLGLLLAGIGLIISGILSVIVLYASSNNIHDLASSTSNIKTMVFLQLISQVVVFIIPSLLFSYLVKNQLFTYFELEDKFSFIKYIIGIICVISAALFIQIMVIDKTTFVFPESLHFFETLAKSAQTEYDKFISQLLLVSNPFMMILIFIMVAVMPAIGEELLFRGVIQKSLENGFKNRWIAIFISGTIFGIIHFEFYNFIALCFMGFVLGYVYSVTKNIYITMLMHFINNGTALISMYLYKKNMISMNPDDKAPIYMVIGGGVVMLISMYSLWKYSSNKEVES